MNLPDLGFIALTLLGTSIAVFTLAITFLGQSIGAAKEQQEKAKKQQEEEMQIKTNDLQNKINALKESGDTSELTNQLHLIEKSKKFFSKQLKQIEHHFSALEFKHSVLVPCVSFIVSLLFSQAYHNLSRTSRLGPIVWGAAASFLLYGITKVVRTLLLAQEVSLVSEDTQFKRSAAAFSAALLANEQRNAPSLQIELQDVPIPFKAIPDTEITIPFKVRLSKGTVVHNVESWFFVPDGFRLVSPPEDKAWKQPANFVIPFIRTVKVVTKRVRTVWHTGSIKVKTPITPGSYLLHYQVLADECRTKKQSLEILVSP